MAAGAAVGQAQGGDGRPPLAAVAAAATAYKRHRPGSACSVHTSTICVNSHNACKRAGAPVATAAPGRRHPLHLRPEQLRCKALHAAADLLQRRKRRVCAWPAGEPFSRASARAVCTCRAVSQHRERTGGCNFSVRPRRFRFDLQRRLRTMRRESVLTAGQSLPTQSKSLSSQILQTHIAAHVTHSRAALARSSPQRSYEQPVRCVAQVALLPHLHQSADIRHRHARFAQAELPPARRWRWRRQQQGVSTSPSATTAP